MKEVEQIQQAIQDWLLNDYRIYLHQVTYTTLGLVSITFYTLSDLEEFLSILKYKSRCDKSGYSIFQDSNTIILKGSAINDLEKAYEK